MDKTVDVVSIRSRPKAEAQHTNNHDETNLVDGLPLHLHPDGRVKTLELPQLLELVGVAGGLESLLRGLQRVAELPDLGPLTTRGKTTTEGVRDAVVAAHRGAQAGRGGGHRGRGRRA